MQMTEKEKQIWKSIFEQVLLENEPWDNKNKSERYNVVYKDIKMPPKVVLARAFDVIDAEYPEIELKSVSGGIQTNQFIEEFGFKISEDLGYNNSDAKKLINHIDKKVSKKIIFKDFINFGYKVLSDLDIEVYKVRMAIESKGILSIIVGMRAAYSYFEKEDYAEIGFLVSKSFKELNKSKYDFTYDYDYKGEPEQDFVKVRVKNWSDIDDELLDEHKMQFQCQYDQIKNSKLTQWNVEANTTNNALKCLMFTNENIDSFMAIDKDIKNIINIGANKIYKLSMGIFFKQTAFKNAKLAEMFEENKWAVMHENTGVNQGNKWVNQINKGDYAYLTFGQDKLSYIIKFNSDLNNLPKSINDIIGNEGYTYRTYEIIQNPKVSNTRNIVSDKRFWLPSGNSTLKEIIDLKEANTVLFEPYYNSKVINDNLKIDQFEDLTQPMNKNFPLNQIFYGPPGTGKTFHLQNEYFSKFIISEENLTKEQVHDKIAEDLSWWQTFAIALRDIGESSTKEILSHPIVKAKERLSTAKSIHPILWSRLQAHTVNDCPNVNVKDRSEPQVFFKTKESKWSLDMEAVANLYPEVDELLNKVKNPSIELNDPVKNFEFVTFHQSFTYEDFVEGIKPTLETGSNEISYELKDGVFKQLANKAEKDPHNNYAIFIDEINRGNVASIFGELITLLEADKRIDAENEIKVRLPYSKIMFGVPKNLYVIGTMNTADRSVEALDSALRRRFSFKEIMPDYDVIKKELENKDQWGNIQISLILEKINQRIIRLIDRDHQIGHSYFLKLKKVTEEERTNALKAIFSENIIPLLQEYFFNDFNKIGLVLGEDFLLKTESQEKLFALFLEGDSSNYEDDVYELVDPKKMTDQEFIVAIKKLIN